MQTIRGVVTGVVMAAALVASPMASAAVDMFLRLDGIVNAGESRDSIHQGEIDVLAWSWAASKPPKLCLNVESLSITKYVDKASPLLLTYLATGQALPGVRLTVRKAGDPPVEYVVLQLSNAIVTSVSTGGSGGEDRLTENVTLSFATMNFKYTQQDATGKPISPAGESNIAGTCR